MKNTLALVLVLLLVATRGSAQQYIKLVASGDGSGTSWDNARGGGAGLDAAVAAVLNGSGSATIYLAAGTYQPQQSTYDFTGKHNLTLRIQGGFPAGSTGTTLSTYNPGTNLTVLDAGYSNATKTGRQFYFAAQNNLTLTMQGLHFTNKQGAGDGYWLRVASLTGTCRITLLDLTYRDNCQLVNASGDGAVRLATLGGPRNATTLLAKNCRFSNNRALNGAALSCATLLSNCRLMLEGCSFSNNTATASGGGSLFFTTCNQARDDDPANITVRNSTFCGNRTQTVADEGGGAIYLTTAKVKIDHCQFSENTALGGSAPNGGAIFGTTAVAQISGCRFVGNQAAAGGAVFLRTDIVAPTGNGYNTTHIDDCDFYGNSTTNTSAGSAEGGGALYVYNKQALTIDNCRFTANRVPGNALGGAVRAYVIGGSRPYDVFSMQNPVFCRNATSRGPAAAGADYSLYDTAGIPATISGGSMQLAARDYMTQMVRTAAAAYFRPSPATGFVNTLDAGSPAAASCPTGIAYVSGAVHLDPDGQHAATGPGTNLGGTLYATLADAGGVVLASVPVGAEGTFGFASDITLGDTYKLVVTTGAGVVGSRVPAATLPGPGATAPDGWAFTTDYDSPLRCASDGMVTLTPQAGQADLYFGVKRRPSGGSHTITIPAPRPNTFVPLDGQGSNPPVATGADPDNPPTPALPLGGMSLRVLALPLSGELYSGPTLLTAGAIVPDPATLRLRVAAGSTAASFQYVALDRAGVASAQPGTYSLSWTAAPLPVQLVDFTARASGDNALLRWSTASELRNDYFEVERSLDGTSFVGLGRQAGQGTKPTATAYTFTEVGAAGQVAAGQPVYYRLRQVDVGGAATFSPVRTLVFGGVGQAALYPNPAVGRTTLDLRALPAAGSYQLQVLDATGQRVRQQVLAGGQAHSLALLGLPAGAYAVLLSGQQADGAALHQVLRLLCE